MPQKDPAYWSALGAEISAQLQAVAEKKSAHEILGVSSNASTKEVQGAYDVWVRRMHPDRLNSAPCDLIEKARQLFTALTEARNLMLDQGKRQAQAQASAVQSAAQRAQEAEVEYTKGKLALAANRLQEAEDHFRTATGLELQNGLYLAELGWAQFLQVPESQRASRVPHSLAELERAAHLSPRSGRVAYLMGMLYKAQGALVSAEQEFRTALQLDSRLREAASELRLLTTRRKTGTYPQAPTALVQQGVERGFLGNIFRRGARFKPKT